jgi:hypothetical protein
MNGGSEHTEPVKYKQMKQLFLCAALFVTLPAVAQVYFDGLYEARDVADPGVCYYLRFFKDGSVQGVVSKPNSSEEVGQWFDYTKFNKEIGKGFYSIAGQQIEITTSFVRKDVELRYVTIDFLRGEIVGAGESLSLVHTHYHQDNIQTDKQVFHFSSFRH